MKTTPQLISEQSREKASESLKHLDVVRVLPDIDNVQWEILHHVPWPHRLYNASDKQLYISAKRRGVVIAAAAAVLMPSY